MKTRQEIKLQAKNNFYANYWPCIGAWALFLIISSGSATFFPAVFFISLPLLCGLLAFNLEIFRGGKGAIETIFIETFSKKYMRKVGGIAWKHLFIFLWSLLFVIPGIIKTMSYAMTEYILTKYTNVDPQIALKLSMKIMSGHKMDLFVMYLSFIGWNILSGFTFGILSLFFVGPYLQCSLCGFYDEAMISAIRDGRITMSELGETNFYEV